eukprot:UN28093
MMDATRTTLVFLAGMAGGILGNTGGAMAGGAIGGGAWDEAVVLFKAKDERRGVPYIVEKMWNKDFEKKDLFYLTIPLLDAFGGISAWRLYQSVFQIQLTSIPPEYKLGDDQTIKTVTTYLDTIDKAGTNLPIARHELIII